MKRRWRLIGLFKADLGLVTECPDKSICCGFDNTTCCAKREGFWIKFGDATTMNPVDAVLLYSAIITTVLSSIYPTSNSLSPTALTSIPSPLPLASTSSPQSKRDQSMSASFPISGITGFQQQIHPKIYTYQGPWSTLQSSSFLPSASHAGKSASLSPLMHSILIHTAQSIFIILAAFLA